ncbi:hypothetical protein PHET_07669 [Paragonimus heterotremus]|uniref:Spermatogenesis-associated protein 6 N-terminal domain-containing protein n=1 Tax=Paragonimus heterotremus TaxID=100268 RepID=A0A8J4TAQ7_9TREM|nr:hypothetical protein PHET_07669 [Paragonimus heterotremus]
MAVLIFKICAPGTRLPENECVYLTVELFGVVRGTNFIIPCFPLSFNDVFLFEKTFIFENLTENLFVMLKDATIGFALYQTNNLSHVGKLLAYYEDSAFSVLFKSDKYSGSIEPHNYSYVSNQEIFLRRTVHFPGPLPRMKLRTVTLIEEAVLKESEGSTETTPLDPSTTCLTHPDVTLITDKEVDKVDPGCSIHGNPDCASMDTGFACGAQFRYALANRSQHVPNCSRYSTVYPADRQRIPSVRLIMTSEQHQHMKDAHDFQGGTLVGTSCCGRTKIQSPDTGSHNVLWHEPTGAPRKTVRKRFRKKVSRRRSRSRSKKRLLSDLRKLARSKRNSSDLTTQLVSLLSNSGLSGQAQDVHVTKPQLLKMYEQQNDELVMKNCDNSEAFSGIISPKQYTVVSESITKPIRNLG